MQKYVRSLAALMFVEGVLTFLWLATLPKSGSTFSPIRSGSLLVILAVSVVWLLVNFQSAFTVRAIQAIVTWKGKVVFAYVCICLPLAALSVALQQAVWSQFIGEALYARLLPVLIWGSMLSIQVGLFLLFHETDPASIAQSIQPVWKPAGIWLAVFMLVWDFITITKLGVTHDVVGLSWGPPGTPITFGQVFLVFTISVNLAILYLLIFEKLIRRPWLLDMLVFVGLWTLAVFLWWNQPMIPSHFAPAPLAPNFEYYPSSDAAVFDKPAYQLLYGAGFNTQLVRRPLYVGMLTLFHKISGPSYNGTIFLQILILAFIPGFIYLLVTKLSSRLAGLLTGGLIVLREANAIHLSGEIIASHAKLMMSDMVTMLGVVVILYVCAVLLTQHEHGAWLPAILGASVGLTTLVRAQTAILLIPALLFIVLAKKPMKTGVRAALFVVLGFVFVLSPWVWRNWHLTGTLVLDDRGEERLLARNYSSNPVSLPLPLENEAEKEFSTRLREEIFSYVLTHPTDVALFVSNHFFHNLMNSVLPIVPHYSDDAPAMLVSRVPFWGSWNGTLSKTNQAFLFINLAIIAFGISIVQKELKFAGWFPLAVFLVYSGGNALVRSSGWRFSLPVDWIILMYYCIALAYIPSRFGALLRRNPLPSNISTVAHQPPSQASILMPVVFSLMFFMGAAVPIAERLIPINNFDNLNSDAQETLHQTKTLSADELNTFLEQDGAIFLSGIALYPRYYQPDSRIYLPDTPTNFSYLYFWIINHGDEQIILPLQNAPINIPHTSKVSLLGCQNENYISAWAIIVHSEPGQILIRDPKSPLVCPLTDPN